MGSTHKQKFSITLDSWLTNLSKTGRSRKQAVSVSVDTVIVVFSLWAAYSLRFGMPFSDFRSSWHLFLFLPFATVIIFMSLGIYRWVVRSSNLSLFKQLLKAVFVSALFLAFFSFLFPTDGNNPRSLFVIYGLVLGAGVCGVRFFWKGIFDAGNRGEPVAIYGAGDAGRQLHHSLTQGSEYRPVLFLDDSESLDGTTIAGLPVATINSSNLDSLLLGLEVEKVILAMPSISPGDYQEKIDLLESTGLPVLTVPTYVELMSGAAELGQVRDISISDILGRSEVPPDIELLSGCVAGKNVLVTGGGGSIGSELCRQIIEHAPAKLVVFDQSEFNLYQITEEIGQRLNTAEGKVPEFLPVLGTVTDFDQISQLMTTESINTVYHAAAYKHVPVIEAQPEQGLQTNVFGTLKVLDASILSGVDNFVFISTDKAVRPTNSMGATKRIAELVLQAKARQSHTTKISMVRFGNVLGSSGSVVPKFKQQIEQGGPITLTHPDVTRYFMTITEAAQLVMQASSIAVGGDVFVLDMGDPVRIEDLAIAMVKTSGKKLKRDTNSEHDIDIRIDGLRPGEKMFEELFITGDHQPTEVSKVFTAQEDWIAWDKLALRLDVLKKMNINDDKKQLRRYLLDIAFLSFESNVPEKYEVKKVDKSSESESLVASMDS